MYKPDVVQKMIIYVLRTDCIDSSKIEVYAVVILFWVQLVEQNERSQQKFRRFCLKKERNVN